MTTDNTERARALTNRIAALGLSGRELAAQSGVARGTVSKALGGTAGRGTYDRLEKFLGDLEHEMESDVDPAATPSRQDHDLVEFRLTGNLGVDVVVRGPVSDLAELEAAVTRLMARMGSSPPQG